MTFAGGLADPGLVEELAGPVQPDDLVVAQLPHQVAGLGVGLATRRPSARSRSSRYTTRSRASAGRHGSGIGHATYRRRDSPGSGGTGARTLPAMERFGFVGLPNAGKSSLYNALAGGGALAAPYAFATTDPNVGMARVPDPASTRWPR